MQPAVESMILDFTLRSLSVVLHLMLFPSGFPNVVGPTNMLPRITRTASPLGASGTAHDALPVQIYCQ